MNIISGILVLGLGWYLYGDVRKNNDVRSDFAKTKAYGTIIMCIILGLGLIFDLVHLW